MCCTGIILHKMSCISSQHTLVCYYSATIVPLQSAIFLPSVLILSAVLTNAKRVALNMTVPSLFRGIFMETRRYEVRRRNRTIILPTHGPKHALPYALMMPCRPTTRLMWASMACGFSYTIIKVFVVFTDGPSHDVFALGSLTHCLMALFSSM